MRELEKRIKSYDAGHGFAIDIEETKNKDGNINCLFYLYNNEYCTVKDMIGGCAGTIEQAEKVMNVTSSEITELKAKYTEKNCRGKGVVLRKYNIGQNTFYCMIDKSAREIVIYVEYPDRADLEFVATCDIGGEEKITSDDYDNLFTEAIHHIFSDVLITPKTGDGQIVDFSSTLKRNRKDDHTK